MKVYFITKMLLIKILLLSILVIIGVYVLIPHMEPVKKAFSSNKEIPIYSVDTTKNEISITFDCAWGGDDIPKLLDILEKYEVKATFFIVGDWMNKYSDNVKLIAKNGHEVANHSYTHPNMTLLKDEEIRKEILMANNKILELTGKQNNLFRPPYGAYNNLVIKTAKSMGQYPIQWDVDSLDWKDLGVSAIIERVAQKVHNGSIILLHNDTKYTVSALPSLIENLRNKGYKFVTVSDLILKDNYYIDYNGVQHNLIKESWSLD